MTLPFLNNPYRVTSPYGVVRTLSGPHRGIDLVCDVNPTIYAACDGIVVRSRIVNDHRNTTWEWGHYITLYDGVYHIIYAHLSKRFVETGEKVHAGQPIGIMGNTGNSFGEHLHLEVRLYDTQKVVSAAQVFAIPNSVGTYRPATPTPRGYVIDTLGLSEQTVKYLDDYEYAHELYDKIYKAVIR